MSDIVKEVAIAAPISSVWAALTDTHAIAAWMGDSAARIDLKVGGCYALFGGETTGKVTRVEYLYRLDYSWRQSSWPSDWADSLVTWELSAEDCCTHLKLTHVRFPNREERDSHDEGWDIYWLEPMVAYLEAEAALKC